MNIMTRRNFLKVMAASIAAISSPMVIAGVLQDPYEKYRKALVLFDQAIMVKGDGTAHVDALFVYFKEANWAAPLDNDETYAAVHEILNGTKESRSRYLKLPPDFLETVWPVALAKIMLCDNRGFWFVPEKMESFIWFHQTYGKFIILHR